MPNYCDYTMKVVGSPDSIREFIDVIQRDDYDAGRHFCRVFEAYVDLTTIEENFVFISGNCAWSVNSCMLEGNWTYSERAMGNYRKIEKEILELSKNKDLVSRHNVLVYNQIIEQENVSSLLRESKLLNLAIEVYSSEPGMCFEEHYVIKNGELLVDECVSMSLIDLLSYSEDFKNVEELNKMYQTNFTEEEFMSFEGEDDFIKVGGFEDWSFDIH